MNILVIPDSHATPEHDNNRYDWLGNLIVDRKPDIIVDIGDHADMHSLSSYDKGKKAFEGRRYENDIESVIDSLDRMFKPLVEHNALRKKKYEPRLVLTLGNHEHRIDRATNDASEFYGWISTKDLEYERFGFEVYPFKEVVNIEGVNFSHYFASGVMDRAIGGVNIGRTLLNRKMASCVQGHSHLLSVSTDVTVNSERVWGVSVGCYVDYYNDYTSRTIQDTYWRGVVMLNNVKSGNFDLETIELNTVREMYA